MEFQIFYLRNNHSYLTFLFLFLLQNFKRSIWDNVDIKQNAMLWNINLWSIRLSLGSQDEKYCTSLLTRFIFEHCNKAFKCTIFCYQTCCVEWEVDINADLFLIYRLMLCHVARAKMTGFLVWKLRPSSRRRNLRGLNGVWNQSV